ncbi:MAG: S-layer protein domain-containing protein [Methanothrix sp.]|nr:S-layer protein domain-containing protein [Methanothrix sp.]
MKSNNLKWFAIVMVISFIAIPIHALEIRGDVAGSVNSMSDLVDNSYTWSPQNFAGFDYDMDHDVGSDTLITTLTEDGKLSGDAPYGIVYETSNLTKMFSNAQPDMEYGKLRVSTIDSTNGIITLDNKDNAIILSKNKNTEIMPGIFIKVADNDTLRYYIYKNITQPGTYEIRSLVAGTVNGLSNLEDDAFTWNTQNFAGFYYDIKKDIGTERLKTTLTDDNNISGDPPYGIVYQTTAQTKDYEYWGWGSYNVIGFQGEEYFAGYVSSDNAEKNVLFRESTDENSLSSEQLQKILMDDKTEVTLNKGESIKLKDGYVLFVKGINSEGQIYLELQKDGKLVNKSFLAPSAYGATNYDKTYCYHKNVGTQKNLVTIAVRFGSTYKDEERALAVVDAIWQISDIPIDVRANMQYGKMTITSVDANAGTITMDNKDNPITLTKKNDIELMPGIHIRTANNDTLRYYIYKTVTVGKAPA